MAFCSKCGTEVSEDTKFCPKCGQNLKVGATPENTSGQGELAAVPEEVKGWNWGAFVLTWIWGVCNGVLISLLALIPLFNIVWAFILAIKGNEWSWRNKKWDSVEHFKNSQRPWDIAGIVLFAISMVALAVTFALIPALILPMFLRG
jgi:hypothetical protein